MKSTCVILVRHGQSTFNAQKRFQGCSDQSVLTAKGHLDAYQTGIALQSIPIDAIYTSPLQRTGETAHSILAALALHPSPRLYLNANLKEIDLPAWQGLPFAYVREQLTADYRCWKERPHEFEMPISLEDPALVTTTKNGQTLKSGLATAPTSFPVRSLYQQVRRFWQEILARHAGETILVISHGGTIRALISTALKINCDRCHMLQQSNCGISTLNFQSSQPAQLEALNLTQHLGEILPKLKKGKLGLRLLLVPVEQFNSVDSQRLASHLKSLKIDFCLNSDTQAVQATALAILPTQPGMVHLQVSQENFLERWHHTIDSRLLDASLTSGLVLATQRAITSTLHQILGLPTDSTALLLKPGTLTVLHYPQSLNRPVIQAMNFLPG